MSISSSLGIGSGIDINSMVSQLIQTEGQPAMSALDTQQSSNQARLSGLGTLKSALSDFKTALTALNNNSALQAQTATSSNTALATVSAGTGAIANSYSMEVVQLAKQQKSITQAGFSDLNAAVGEGSLNIAVGTNAPFSIAVNAGNNTLAGIRDAINSSSSNNGVTASIINVDDGSGGTVSKLMLSATNPGTSNSFTVSGTETGGSGAGLSHLFTSNLSQINAASDAIIKVDGQTATRSSNNITDVIPGVTLNLVSAPTTSTPFNITIAQDNASITKTANDFVTAYNKLQSALNSLGSYNQSTKVTGALNGDATLRSVQNAIRTIASNTVSTANSHANSLMSLGFNIDQYGVMSLDSTKFANTLSTNPNAVSEVFSSSNGIATQLNSKLSLYLQSGGTLDSQTSTINDTLKSISTRRADEQARLDALQASMLKQFQAMDSIVGQFKSIGTLLSQKFG